MPKPATKAEKAHMDAVASLGCIACRKFGYMGTPCQIHHCRKHSERRNHMKTIGLCLYHHTAGPLSRHGNPALFLEQFGTDDELLAEVEQLLGMALSPRKL